MFWTEVFIVLLDLVFVYAVNILEVHVSFVVPLAPSIRTVLCLFHRGEVSFEAGHCYCKVLCGVVPV